MQTLSQNNQITNSLQIDETINIAPGTNANIINDPIAGTISFGDNYGTLNNTTLVIDDTSESITLTSSTSVALGDVNNVANNTHIDINSAFDEIILQTNNVYIPTLVSVSLLGTDASGKIIPASGGGGGGITRSINSISTPTTAGATALTDYVYLISGTTTLTLPTAVSNTNRYTLKNSGTNTVTINTTSSQTIDGSTSITLIPNQSIDVISNNSNWFII